MHLAQNMKQAPFYDRKNVFLCLGYTQPSDRDRMKNSCLAGEYVVSISRVMCSKWTNVTGLNLCLEKTVYVPYTLVRTRHKRQDSNN